MDRAADVKPGGETETPKGYDVLNDASTEDIATTVFASVDAEGLDFATTYDASAPLNPLVFALDATDDPAVPETDVNKGRKSADAKGGDV